MIESFIYITIILVLLGIFLGDILGIGVVVVFQKYRNVVFVNLLVIFLMFYIPIFMMIYTLFEWDLDLNSTDMGCRFVAGTTIGYLKGVLRGLYAMDLI